METLINGWIKNKKGKEVKLGLIEMIIKMQEKKNIKMPLKKSEKKGKLFCIKKFK